MTPQVVKNQEKFTLSVMNQCGHEVNEKLGASRAVVKLKSDHALASYRRVHGDACPVVGGMLNPGWGHAPY